MIMLSRRKERLEEEVKSGKRKDERKRAERKQRETDRGVKTMFIACA